MFTILFFALKKKQTNEIKMWVSKGSGEPSQHLEIALNFIWFSLAVFLVFAFLGEWKAVTTETDKAKSAINNASKQPLGAPGFCDTIAYASQLSQSQMNADSIQWRRGLIASTILVAVVPTFLGMEITSKQTLILLTISWLVFTGMAGYANYHLDKVSNGAVNDILKLSISRFDPATCNPALINSM